MTLYHKMGWRQQQEILVGYWYQEALNSNSIDAFEDTFYSNLESSTQYLSSSGLATGINKFTGKHTEFYGNETKYFHPYCQTKKNIIEPEMLDPFWIYVLISAFHTCWLNFYST